MNKLPVLLCIFLLSACAPSEVPSYKLVDRNGIKYEINSQIPFTGVSTDYYENGRLKEKYTYKDGEQNGLNEGYHENGQLLWKGTFKDGELNGLWEAYRENGQEENFFPKCYQNGKKVDMSKCK